MTHRWTVRPWTAERPKWGVEIWRRPRVRHSQVRLSLGRRRYTLMSVAYGKARP